MDWALSETGPKLSTAIVTGPMPRKPKATSPKAKTGVANSNSGGMMLWMDGFLDTRYAMSMSTRIASPSQNAEKLPATAPAQDVQRGSALARRVHHLLAVTALGAREDLRELGDQCRRWCRS